MRHLNLELDQKTYQRLKTKFQGDEKAICDFAVKAIKDGLEKPFTNKSKTGPDKHTKDLESYLKSGNSGSRSYGTKGQGW